MLPFVFRFPVPDEQLYDVGNWHSPYLFLAFFQARIALFESFGVTQEILENNGLAIIAVHLESDYYVPLLKNDVVLIEITPCEVGRSSMVFSCRVYREEDQEKRLCAEGKTKQKLIDRNTKKSVELPEWIRNPLSELLKENSAAEHDT